MPLQLLELLSDSLLKALDAGDVAGAEHYLGEAEALVRSGAAPGEAPSPPGLFANDPEAVAKVDELRKLMRQARR
jgi:hypothetical protein